MSWSALRREQRCLRAAPAPERAGVSGTAVDALLDQLPDPVVRVDARARVDAANRAARALLPALREGDPLSLSLRSPDVLEAVDAVIRTREALEVELAL